MAKGRTTGGKNKTTKDVLDMAEKALSSEGTSDYAEKIRPVLLYLLHECFFLKPPENERVFAERAFKFFDMCIKHDMAPTLPALATSLGYCSVNSLRFVANYSGGNHSGTVGNENEEMGENQGKRGPALLAQNCITFVETVCASYAFDRAKVIGALFTLKTGFGYVEASPERNVQQLPQVTINFLGGSPQRVDVQINSGHERGLIPALDGIQKLEYDEAIANGNG